jgi:hypothetical protein
MKKSNEDDVAALVRKVRAFDAKPTTDAKARKSGFLVMPDKTPRQLWDATDAPSCDGCA